MKTVYFRKMKNPFHTVGGKLFFIYFISITLMVGAVGYFSYDQSARAIEQKVSVTASQVIGLAADKVETEIKGYQDLTMQVISDADFLRLLGDYRNPDITGYDHYAIGNNLGKKLSQIALWKDGLRNVSVLPLVAEKGLMGKSYSGISLTTSPLEEKWFQEVVKENGRAVYLPTREKGYYASDKPAFGIARLLIDGSTGAKVGVLLLEIDEEVLDRALGNITFGKDATIAVLDTGNRLVRSHNQEDIGKPYPFSFTAKDRDHASKAPVMLRQNGNLVIYRTLDMSNWVVVTAIPLADLLRETDQIRNMTLLMVLGAILVAILLGVWVLKMVGNPLNRMRLLMQEAENGNLAVRVKTKSKDEIGEVGRSFNHMMERFSDLIREIYHNSITLMKHAEDLLHSSKSTAASAKDLASATEEIAQGAGQLAAEAEKGISLTQEMRSRMEEVEAANGTMGRSVYEVEEASDRGSAYMNELTKKTAVQEEIMQKMVNKIRGFKKSMESIGEILEILQGITKQTNILSLNASIEAARAGEAGKGFAVVADEVRNLADQSKQSIDVVGKTVNRIDQEIFETMEVVGAATSFFQEQIASIKEGDLLFKSVNEKMGILKLKLQEVMDSQRRLESSQKTMAEIMGVLSGFSEESSASSEEVASISHNQLEVSNTLVGMSEALERLSRDMERRLNRFKI